MTERLKTSRWSLAGLLLLPLAALGLSALPEEQVGVPPAPRVLPVAVLEVTPVDGYELVRRYTGELRARRSIRASFELDGRLDELAVDEGDRVSAGDVLARLDTRRLEVRRREVAANRDQAAALLDEMRAGPRVESIDAARAEVRSLQEQLELQEKKRERREELLERRAISGEALEEAAHGEASMAAMLDAASSRLDELETGTRPERIRAQQARLDMLDAALAAIDVDLADSTLRAPFDGTIAARRVDEGSVVSPGQAVLELVEDSALEARVGVPPEVAGDIRVGDEHGLWIDGEGEPRRLAARVTGILPELDAPTRTTTLILELEPLRESNPRVGRVVRLEIERGVDTPGIWVPTSALTSGSRGLWSVLVAAPVDDGSYRLERAAVEVLTTDGDRALVRGTIFGGDLVVADGTHRVVPGQLVEPLAETALARP